MSEILAAIGRKVLSLTLIFNSIISLISAANMLASFYMNGCGWRPFSPYLIEGSLFWFVILTSLMNIVPAKIVGKVNIKRILFHHYVYGFLVSSISLLSMVLFAPAYLLVLLTPSLGFQTSGLQTIPLYASFFFVYGGLTLVIDDINDVSLRVRRSLDKLKMRICKSGKMLQTMHLCSSLVSIYIVICSLLWYFENIFWIKNSPLLNIAHIIFMLNLLVTSLWGLKAVKEKLWLRKIFADLSKIDLSVHKN